MKANHPKQNCAAFGCKRWSRKWPPGWSFLCRDHWAMVPRDLRRLHRRARKREADNDDFALWSRGARIWARCIKIATEESLMGVHNIDR